MAYHTILINQLGKIQKMELINTGNGTKYKKIWSLLMKKKP
jgi:hypothetical protein